MRFEGEGGQHCLPYFIALDHEKQAVVLAIRGTLSLQDTVTGTSVPRQNAAHHPHAVVRYVATDEEVGARHSAGPSAGRCNCRSDSKVMLGALLEDAGVLLQCTCKFAMRAFECLAAVPCRSAVRQRPSGRLGAGRKYQESITPSRLLI